MVREASKGSNRRMNTAKAPPFKEVAPGSPPRRTPRLKLAYHSTAGKEQHTYPRNSGVPRPQRSRTLPQVEGWLFRNMRIDAGKTDRLLQDRIFGKLSNAPRAESCSLIPPYSATQARGPGPFEPGGCSSLANRLSAWARFAGSLLRATMRCRTERARISPAAAISSPSRSRFSK